MKKLFCIILTFFMILNITGVFAEVMPIKLGVLETDNPYERDYELPPLDDRQFHHGSMAPELLPSSFTSEHISPVKNQGKIGVCWTFSAIGMVESALLRKFPDSNGDKSIYDFSEEHMRYALSDTGNNPNGFIRSPAAGGNSPKAMAYLMRREGLVDEVSDPYTVSDTPRDYSITQSKPKSSVFVKEMIDIPDLEAADRAGLNEKKLAHIKRIKTLVYDYDVVATAVFYDTESFSADMENLCYNPSSDVIKGPDHAVSIIGWDDTYSALNFKNPPAGDGAFLIKNSHGDTANNGDGLFHLSYYDLYAGFNAYAIPEVMYDGNFNIYEYDKMGMNASFGYSQAASIEYACVFEKKNSDPEYITAISFYATNPNSKYEILINAAMPASQEKPSFKDMTSILEKSIEYSGYYTVELPVPIKISDSKFVIAIQPTTLNGTNARAAVETTSKSINFVPSLNSYIRLGNSPQEYQQLPNADVCIKAITKSTNSPITAVNSLRDGKFHTVLKNNTGVALDGKLCIGTYENMILTDITFADIHSNSYDTSADFSILAPAENGKTYKSIYLKDLPSIQPLTQP